MKLQLIPLVFLLVSAPLPALGEKPEVARLYSKEGDVRGQFPPDGTWRPIEIGTVFGADDAVRVTRSARAGILFKDGMLVRLAGNSTMRFQAKQGEPQQLNLEQGDAHLFRRSDAPAVTRVNTSTVSAAIRGTEFIVSATPDRTIISVIDGTVECENQHGVVQAGRGEQVVAPKGSAPVKSLLLHPEEAAQWALSYPAVLDLDDYADFAAASSAPQREGLAALHAGDLDAAAAKFSGNTWRDVMGRSIVLLRRGDLSQAAALLEGYRGAEPAGLLLYRANLALAVGDVHEAEAFLAQSSVETAKAPTDTRPRLQAAIAAAQSVIALTQNRNEQALRFAETGAAQAPQAPSVLLAQGYAAQAGMNLERAKALTQQLIAAQPQNGFAYARLADLELAFGNIEEARAASDQAVVLDPESSYVQAVSGFVKLTRSDADGAVAAFRKAIALDNGAALPHLGLGLAEIRKGDLAGGRAEIEKATALEPNAAVYRSYLGKVFFEEDNEERAGNEYDLALSMDPNDPTPYLYRAFNNLAENQPVAALSDVEDSIARNDNRAVYRSRLLLDRDLAVRSAGLGQVFNELGFQDAARVEAIKSIGRDYSNYSAHRLLGDSYRSVLRADSRLSEYRIAQLLAPLGFNTMYAAGRQTSFLDYYSLFDRPEQRTGGDLSYLSWHDVASASPFVAGKTEDWGYYMGYQTEYGGGSKHGNYRRSNAVQGIVEYAPSYRDHLIADVSYDYLDSKIGPYEAFPAYGTLDDRSSDADNDERSFSSRLSYTRRFDAKNTGLTQLSFDYNKEYLAGLVSSEDVNATTINPMGEAEQMAYALFVDENQRARLRRLDWSSQHIYSGEWLTAVTGLQLAREESKANQNSPIIDSEPYLFANLNYALQSQSDNLLNSYSVYQYLTWKSLEWAEVTAGYSAAGVESDLTETAPFADGTFSRHGFLPKAGITLYPLPELTVRSAYFQSLRKSVTRDFDAIEPVVLGGIDQRFNDFVATRSENWGVGIDYKIPKRSYFGAEFIDRHLSYDDAWTAFEPTFDFQRHTIAIDPRLERTDRAYERQEFWSFYWSQVLAKELTLTNSCLLGRSDFNSDRTSRVRSDLAYFDRSGVFADLAVNWRKYELGDDGLAGGEGSSATDRFWTIDAGVGYRLPNRHGRLSLQLLNLFDEKYDFSDPLGTEELVPNGRAAMVVFSGNF